MADHNDIYSIVERLAILEGRITPANVKHGLNPQQKSVPQMPALFKPKTQKILGGDPNAKNPMAGYAVGGCEESVEVDEETEVAEGVATEDVLDKVKKSFTDFIKNIENEIKIDTDLKDKTKDDRDLKKKEKKDRDLIAKAPAVAEDPTQSEPSDNIQLPGTQEPLVTEAPVKTFALEDGTCLECYGDENQGFEIRRNGRRLPTRFKDLDQADMALQMYMNHRRKKDESQDYIDEA